MGVSIDLITITGMILVIGILVDDAIIVAERYTKELEEGAQPLTASVSAAYRLIFPVTGTILTTIVAFSPIIFVPSELGIILMGVPIVVISALFFSWFESFYILPNHLQHFIKKPRPTKRKIMVWLERNYSQLLQGLVKWRYFVFTFFLIVFGGSIYFGSQHLKQDFSFHIGVERASVRVYLNKDVKMTEAKGIINKVHEGSLGLLKRDEVDSLYTSHGRFWDNGQVQEGIQYVRFNYYLASDLSHPKEYKSQLEKDLKELFPTLLEQDPLVDKWKIGWGIENEEEKESQSFTINLKGKADINYKRLDEFVENLVKSSEVPIEKVGSEENFIKKWVFEPKFEEVSRYGVSLTDLASQLKSFFLYDRVGDIRIDGESYDIKAKIKSEDVQYESLPDIEVINSAGRAVPVSALGSWKKASSRERLAIKMEKEFIPYSLSQKANFLTKNRKKVTEHLKSQIGENKALFPGLSLEVLSGNEQNRENKSWAVQVTLFCIFGVFLVLSMTLKSLSQPILVALPIPFGIIGVIWALYFHSLPMGIMAMIGLVGVIGVGVNDSLILVDQVNFLAKKAGRMTYDVIIKGAVSRLRAIMLTTVTTLGGSLSDGLWIRGRVWIHSTLGLFYGVGVNICHLSDVDCASLFHCDISGHKMVGAMDLGEDFL